jgi:predicted flap endonuclease-1-like 5' DNA nuclease
VPLTMKLQAVEQRLAGMRMPEAPKPVDLQPLHDQIKALNLALTSAVSNIRITAPPPPAAPTPPTDLSGVQARLTALEEAIARLRFPEPKAVDFSALYSRLDSLQARLDARPAPAPAPTPAPAQVAAPAQQHVRAGSRNLLTKAAHGKPDDLQRIKGVAGVLERMLHGIGVYYFWQIAEWTPTDIEHVDAQLTAFKGRIARDHWVDQAKQFSREGGVAVKP